MLFVVSPYCRIMQVSVSPKYTLLVSTARIAMAAAAFPLRAAGRR